MGRNLFVALLLCGCIPLPSSGPLGCGKKPTCPPRPPDYSYKVRSSPENVMNNLVLSYRRREKERYAEILHREFIFRFQDGDRPPALGREFWTHDEDSTGTEALFNSHSVADILIDLTYGAAEPAPDLGTEGIMKIRVFPMKLAVDDVDGTTYLVEGDLQDMFFCRGDGADSTNWYLLEWRDIPGSGGAGAPGTSPTGATVKATTWGKLKQIY